MRRIHFFGGYRATEQDVQAWALSARRKMLPRVPARVPDPEPAAEYVRAETAFNAFAWPAGADAGNPLPQWRKDTGGSGWLARTILASGASDDIILIGHSSGCAIANDVAAELVALECDNFALIALDGFVPAPNLLALPRTRVWSARNYRWRLFSRNYMSCRDRAGGAFRVHEASVTMPWPLHFSLVNVNVSDHRPELTDGYCDCDANLAVLELEDVQ